MASYSDYSISEEDKKKLTFIWKSIASNILDFTGKDFFNFVEENFPSTFNQIHLYHLSFITCSSFAHKDGYINIQNKYIDDSIYSLLLRDSLSWLERHRLICILRNGWDRKIVSFLSSHKFFPFIENIKEKEKNKFLESFWPFWKDLKLE